MKRKFSCHKRCLFQLPTRSKMLLIFFRTLCVLLTTKNQRMPPLILMWGTKKKIQMIGLSWRNTENKLCVVAFEIPFQDINGSFFLLFFQHPVKLLAFLVSFVCWIDVMLINLLASKFYFLSALDAFNIYHFSLDKMSCKLLKKRTNILHT